MSNLRIPVGVSDFEQIRKNGYYYIDKSGMITEIIRTEPAAVTLITRPRRFGKTLGMSMLASFFDVRRESAALFEGLSVEKDTELCGRWMNQYPTVFLSLKDVDGLSFESAYGMLAATIRDLYKEHLYLLDSEAVNVYDREEMRQIVEGRASVTEIKRSLVLLITAMRAHYGKPVIFLMDEYDVPLSKASSHGYYEQMLEVMKTLMSTTLKDNPSLKFAVLTGCLKVAKESIFTGTNNFVSDTISDSRLDEYFGFTQKDVDRLLEEAGRTERKAEIRAWYDGYHFGDFDVYCPWDVMNYLRDLEKNAEAKPMSYWKNTSDNAIIRSFIDYAGSNITGKLETLMAGGYIVQRVEENLTYDYLHSSEENLWSLLYLTGYLTRVRSGELRTSVPEGMMALKIPNAEIQEIFETTVQTWFADSARVWDRRKLFEAVWSGDVETLTKEMNTLLRTTISYHDYGEDFYHAFLAGIFAGAGSQVESNREHGEGRSDVVVLDLRGSRAAIFEAKCIRKPEQLENGCLEALCQIREKGYAEDFRDSYDEVLCFGIAFYKKRCLVRR